MTSGIYQITNTINGKRYIGSAININRRWSEHRCRLRKNNHHSKPLQNAWNKYGEAAFQFEFLWSAEPEMLLFEEQQALNWLICEYNILSVAGSRIGAVCTAETKAKISSANKGRIQSAAEKLVNRDKQRSRIGKGYGWHKTSKKWRASIVVDKKHYHLGLFLTEEEAHASYLSARSRLFGD